jgi:CheY-like chemotaxis protein
MPSILIVEDDDATRLGLETLFQNAGYNVRAVASVPAGLKALRAETPDLLISDIRVAGYNGLQLVVEQTPPVRAIFVTGFPDPVLAADARSLGADFLLKPIAPRALLALVDQRLGGAAPQQDASKPIRRWPRMAIPGDIAAQVAASQARIIDVSYGGLRIAIDATGAKTLPPSFSVRVPVSEAAPLDVDLVWKLPHADGEWLCGLAIAESHQSAWRQVIDDHQWKVSA